MLQKAQVVAAEYETGVTRFDLSPKNSVSGRTSRTIRATTCGGVTFATRGNQNGSGFL
jgi:hypothetical protein